MTKKKILLLSDDLRMNSGIATMSRELVLSTVHKYDWVQLAGAITHPEKGHVFDLSQATNDLKKIKDAYVKLYPTDGYGNEQILFQLIAMEKPDAILHFTDPRFWGWLYALEKQIRGSGIPICYYNIWDDVPYPMYNRPYYESCDVLFSISKQTYNINKWVLGPERSCNLLGTYKEDGDVHVSDDFVNSIIDDVIKKSIETTFVEGNILIEDINHPLIVKYKNALVEHLHLRLVNSMGTKLFSKEELKSQLKNTFNELDQKIMCLLPCRTKSEFESRITYESNELKDNIVNDIAGSKEPK